MSDDTVTVGEALILLLEQAEVKQVFGIPGVHTIELYRGLGNSRIRHITPRHEQGAGFMADGYARATGKPGVCLLITGPGFSNAITAMAQARADSIPMLVLSGVNARATLGKGLGHLHELPDQAGLSRTVALWTHTLTEPDRLAEVFAEAWMAMTSGRPGPVHLEIPIDVMGIKIPRPKLSLPEPSVKAPNQDTIDAVVQLAEKSERILIFAGGGVKRHSEALGAVAEALDAPVVSTINARGMLAGHPLHIPASPDLAAVRALADEADLLLAVGTELGSTDYDIFGRGMMDTEGKLVRVDIDAEQLARGPKPVLPVEADAGAFLAAFGAALPERAPAGGKDRAAAARDASMEEIGPRYRELLAVVERVWEALPDATIVGDSTQLIYAGNMMINAPRPMSWFNSSSGFGTLGYAAPAGVGAALGVGPVVSISGDGGMQFSLAEIGSAVDCNADVAFLVWNNNGYEEIEIWMNNANIAPVGVTPSAPDFEAVAKAYGLPAARARSSDEMVAALRNLPRPCLIEIIGGEVIGGPNRAELLES